MLLLICGGPTDAGVYAGLAAALMDRYTVVTYDPRGNSRSPFGGEPRDLDVDEQGDDAASLLAEYSREPAFVFGSSGGGQIGLNLTARHPERVRALVAHEPPCMQLLADPGEWAGMTDTILSAYRAGGTGAAFAIFGTHAGIDARPPSAAPPPPELLATNARVVRNGPYFLAHGMLPLSSYVPDVPKLRTGPPVTVGIGALTEGKMAHRSAAALAVALGTVPVTFPGDHVGYGRHAAEFAGILAGIYSTI